MNRRAVKEIKMIVDEYPDVFEAKVSKYVLSKSPQYDVEIQYEIKGLFYTALVIVRHFII